MKWNVFLGTELATTYDKGSTPGHAAELYLAENFPQHASKNCVGKIKAECAEIHCEDIHLRVEKRTEARAAA